MSKSVKIWASLLLLTLAGYALYSMVRISNQLSERSSGQKVADAKGGESENPVEPVNLDSFEMTSQGAEQFPFKELEGKVWIASLFFSSCPHECKSLNQAIAALNRDPDFKEVQFVSISVDPDVDSPQTLAEYAQLFDADPEKWLFLTSDLSQVARFGRAINVPAGFKTHSRRLVLVDKQGKPRGQFSYNDAADIARLKAELPAILAEPADAGKAIQNEEAKSAPINSPPSPPSALEDQAA